MLFFLWLTRQPFFNIDPRRLDMHLTALGLTQKVIACLIVIVILLLIFAVEPARRSRGRWHFGDSCRSAA
jgi:hypothetical protein